MYKHLEDYRLLIPKAFAIIEGKRLDGSKGHSPKFSGSNERDNIWKLEKLPKIPSTRDDAKQLVFWLFISILFQMKGSKVT